MKKKEILIVLLILGFVYLLLKLKKKTILIDGENNTDPVIMDGDGSFQNNINSSGISTHVSVYGSGGIQSDRIGQYDTDIEKLGRSMSGECINPKFFNKDISGRMCSGSVINENKVLRLGDNSCEVLLLQQRLNSMETERNILEPNGQFCCECKAKLMRLMRVPQIALNQFSPDEQIGFNELVGGTKITPYSYMDLTTKEKTNATRR